MKLKPIKDELKENLSFFNEYQKSRILSVINKKGLLHKDELNYLIEAHKYMLNKKTEADKEKKRLDSLSISDRLWEKYSSSGWDEESGPYEYISKNSYDKLLKELFGK